MDDAAYMSVFKPVITKVMEVYAPEAVVLQCGADSLSGVWMYLCVSAWEQ